MTKKQGTEIWIKMQDQIASFDGGYGVLIKLLNYQELTALEIPPDTVLHDLINIVKEIESKFNILLLEVIAPDQIFLVSSVSSKALLKDLAFEIYSKSQLYFSLDHPAKFMQCNLASLDLAFCNRRLEEAIRILQKLLQNSDIYNYYYEYNQQVHSIDKLRLDNIKLNQFRQAIKNRTVQFAYQPIIDRTTLEIHYYECLLRMPDKNGQMVSVGPIINVVESKGLINLLDHIVFEMAVQELVKDPQLKLSVNISNVGILDDHLLKFAEELLSKHQVATRLTVEITETILNQDYQRTKIFIDKLHGFGCNFALDDFGSGFTSFRQLQNLPIDIIKIDGSYIKDITSNSHSRYFVEALIKISEELGIKTVAEFVENGEIAKFLVDLKIDGMQGNFFSPADTHR